MTQSPGTIQAQAADSPTATLQAISVASSLDTADVRPWHLKLAFSTFDGTGASTGEGTFEESWAAPDKSRLEINFGGQTSTRLITPDGTFFSPGGFQETQDEELLLAQVVHPVAKENLDDAIPETYQQSFGKTKLQCIMLSRPIKGQNVIPLGMFPTYCADANSLCLVWLSTNTNVVNSQVGKFQGHVVPTQVVIDESGKKRLEGHVAQLSTMTPEALDSSTSGLVKGPPGTVRISGHMMQSSKISGPPPVYPAEAKLKQISGTVVLDVGIGTDGRVHAPQVLSSPDANLSVAAIVAVEQWIYKPYSLNGLLVPLKTTVTVNFNMAVRSF